MSNERRDAVLEAQRLLTDENKAMLIGLCEELAEEILQGKISRMIVVGIAPDGTLDVHARGGFITDSVGALQAAIALLMQKALGRSGL